MGRQAVQWLHCPQAGGGNVRSCPCPSAPDPPLPFACAQDRRAFVRDVVAYALSVLALLGLMLRGTFSAWEAGLLLAGYCAYLGVCLAISRAGGAGGSGSGGGGGGAQRHAYFEVSPSQEQLQMAEQQALVAGGGVGAANGGSGVPADEAEAFGARTGVQLPRQLSGVVVAGGAALPAQLAGQQVELVSRGGGLPPQRKSVSNLASPDGASRPTSPFRDKPPGEPGAGQEEAAALVGGLAPSDGGALALALGGPSPRGGAVWRPKLAAGHGSRMGKMVHSASLGLEELLHLHGKSGPRLWLSLAMAPAMLLLHATMPALHPGGAGERGFVGQCKEGGAGGWHLAAVCRLVVLRWLAC